ncbi:MAG: class I SAM-dependent methyltransferase [Solirubrobacteraceae bacterium]|nr:class I SAM-dependent methyltransferase [Solirubrobacteraceae bacterium]
MTAELAYGVPWAEKVDAILPRERGWRGAYVRAIQHQNIVGRGVRFTAKRAMRPSYGRSLDNLAHLYEVGHLLNRRGLTGLGVEVGVKRGRTSAAILGSWRGRLISIDPWQAAPTEEYYDTSNVTQDEHDSYYAETRQRLAPYGERSEIWRMTGNEGAQRIGESALDFAFIDARHDYESVLEDLADWYPRMRPGAIFAGHDYFDGDLPGGTFGVRRAVDEYFGARGIPVHTTFGDRPWVSWVVEIPRG